MTHHTNLHVPPSPVANLTWFILLNVTTAVVALVVNRILGLGLAISIVIGFAVAAAVTSLIHEVWHRTL